MNIDVLCKLKGIKETRAQEKYLCHYLASILPCEFYIYFNRVGLQSFFRDQNKPNERSFKRSLAQKSFVAKQLRSIKKKYSARIAIRKQQKNAYYVKRSKDLSADELTRLEKCKEVKVFSNKEPNQILDFILKAVQLDVDILKEHKPVLCFFNYAVTVRLK